jgi:hypothetical protein
MSRVERHPAYRLWKAEPSLSGNNKGNLGTLAESEAQEKAAAGSASLAAAILLTVGCETPDERAPLSFEQQIALVEAGKARIVPVPRIPSRAYEGGVGSAAAMVAECA